MKYDMTGLALTCDLVFGTWYLEQILWASLFHASHWALQQTHKIIFLIYKLIPHCRLENKRPPTQK